MISICHYESDDVILSLHIPVRRCSIVMRVQKIPYSGNLLQKILANHMILFSEEMFVIYDNNYCMYPQQEIHRRYIMCASFNFC